MFILAFFACAPTSDVLDAPDGAALAGAKDEPAPGDVPPVPTRLHVVYDSAIAGFVEARPYAYMDGRFECGPPLFVEELDVEETMVSLPDFPPTADHVAPTEPVVYAIALRDTNDDGLPGRYAGLTGPELVWLPADSGDGGSAGWNMAIHYGKSDVEWLEYMSPLLEENLVGRETLTLAGTLDIPMTEGLRLAIATSPGDDGITIWDNRVGGNWYGTLPDQPRTETIRDMNGMYGALFGGFAYVDEGDDGLRTDEDWAGRLYADGAPVLLSWVAPVHTLEAALTVRANQTRMGWTPYAWRGDHVDPVDEEMEITIDVY